VLRKLIFMMLCLGIISGFLLLVSTVEAGSYNRAAAVTYADTWAHGRNSAYPSFGSGCNCNDCTNYISQVLHNGGYPLRTGNWNKESIYEWWYRKVLWWYETSNTWSAADWLMMYAAQYTEFEFRSSPTELERGDFFLVDLRDNNNPSGPPDGKPDHGRVIVGYGYTSTNQADYTNGCGVNYPIPSQVYTLLINQHCVDRWHVKWDYRLPANIRYWAIHVRW
jgi:hypothetical protein